MPRVSEVGERTNVPTNTKCRFRSSPQVTTCTSLAMASRAFSRTAALLRASCTVHVAARPVAARLISSSSRSQGRLLYSSDVLRCLTRVYSVHLSLQRANFPEPNGYSLCTGDRVIASVRLVPYAVSAQVRAAVLRAQGRTHAAHLPLRCRSRAHFPAGPCTMPVQECDGCNCG